MFISNGFCPPHFKRKIVSRLLLLSQPNQPAVDLGVHGPWKPVQRTLQIRFRSPVMREFKRNSYPGEHPGWRLVRRPDSEGSMSSFFQMLKHEPFWQKQCYFWGDMGLCWQLGFLVESLGLDWGRAPTMRGEQKGRQKVKYEGPRRKWRIKPTNIIIFIITRTKRVESYKWILKGVILMWSWDRICSLSSIDAHWAQSKRCNGQSPHPSTCWRSWGCWVCGFCCYAMSYSDHEVDSDGCKKRRTDVRSLFFNPFRSRTEIFTAIHFFLPLFVAFSDHGCHCYHLRFLIEDFALGRCGTGMNKKLVVTLHSIFFLTTPGRTWRIFRIFWTRDLRIFWHLWGKTHRLLGWTLSRGWWVSTDLCVKPTAKSPEHEK